jgi:hypothetical protein
MARVDGSWLQYSTVLMISSMSEKSSSGSTPLRVHVERDRHQAAVAGALAIAEQAAFDAVAAGHQAQFRRRHAGAAVVVGVERDHHAVAVGDHAAEHIRSGRHRCWASPHSTVAGRLKMIGCSGVGLSTSITAAQHSRRESTSAVEKVSGCIRSASRSGILRRLIAQHLAPVDGDAP